MAKIASKWQKPSGLTVIKGRDMHTYLAQKSVADVWGIGAKTTAYLAKLGSFFLALLVIKMKCREDGLHTLVGEIFPSFPFCIAKYHRIESVIAIRVYIV